VTVTIANNDAVVVAKVIGIRRIELNVKKNGEVDTKSLTKHTIVAFGAVKSATKLSEVKVHHFLHSSESPPSLIRITS
jgi:hypothetical protein